jgi:hypothetical protein
VFIGILIFLIISEKEIYSIIQKKEGKEAGKEDIGKEKLKKRNTRKKW